MAKTYKQIMEEARQVVPEASPDEVKSKLDRSTPPMLLDVREKEEFRQGYVPGAVSLPRGFLEMRVEDAVPDKNTPIVAYCAGGTRSLLAGRILKELGYTNVTSMRGGFTAWKNQGLPVAADRQFTAEQQIRYSRHFLLPEVGEAGQAKPLVDGAIWQFEGQATVFNPPAGPCYRCLFPEPPPPGSTPSCAEAGVLGVLPGLVGCVQALETIKLILGKGKTLVGRMMHFDTLTGDVRTLRLRRDPKCAVCGEHPTIRELIDYEMFCGLGGDATSETPEAAASSAA